MGSTRILTIGLATAAVAMLLALAGCGGGGGQSEEFSVGGTLTGLADGHSVALMNNAGDELTLSQDGSFTFPTKLQDETAYQVTVSAQPAGQTCLVAHGSGLIVGADITGVTVTCESEVPFFHVGGTVSGLDNGKSVVLQNNGADDLDVASNTSFTFPVDLADGTDYAVSVLTQPAGQSCLVANASGVIDGADVTSVTVTCGPEVPSHSVGGTVSGMDDGKTVVLQNNGTDDLDVATNGSFTFPTQLPQGSQYQVSVLTMPQGQGCRVSNGSGTLDADVNDVQVTCAKSGDPDATFANPNGTVINHNAAGGNADDRAYDVIVDSQDRVLVTGFSRDVDGNAAMVLARYRPDGTPDPTFGSDGFVAYGNGGNGDAVGRGIAVSEDDQLIYVAGYRRNLNDAYDIVVWAFQEDGTLNQDFSNGTALYNNLAGGGGAADDNRGFGILLDASGNLIVCGMSINPDGNKDMVVIRIAPDGSLLDEFSHDGAAGGNGADEGYAITHGLNQTYVVAGISTTAQGDTDAAVWRLKADLTLDDTFNGTGFTTAAFQTAGVSDTAHAVAVDDQGRVIITGSGVNQSGDMDMALIRFLADGTWDDSFGTNGVVVDAAAAYGIDGHDEGMDLAIDGQGRIVVAGYSGNGSGDADVVVWRYLVDGTRDPDFGNGGAVVRNSMGGGMDRDIAFAVALDSQERILVAGYTTSSGGQGQDLLIMALVP